MRQLEQENASLESRIREWCEQQVPYLCPNYESYFQTIEELQKKVRGSEWLWLLRSLVPPAVDWEPEHLWWSPCFHGDTSEVTEHVHTVASFAPPSNLMGGIISPFNR